MTERERLIEILKAFCTEDCKITHQCGYCDYYDLPVCASAVADHLLSNGVIVPPCKVGETVYIVDGTTDGIVVGTITHFEQNIYTAPKEWITFKGNYPFFGELESKDRVDLLIGKTVFLSREEAEKALKERKEN